MNDKLNLQEIFDRVARHLLTQNAKSFWSNGDCAYLSGDGKKCAVGCLIPESLYSTEFEGKPVESLPDEVLEACGLLDEEGLLLAGRLQALHDCSKVLDWPYDLRFMAVEYGLSSKVVDDFVRK